MNEHCRTYLRPSYKGGEVIVQYIQEALLCLTEKHQIGLVNHQKDTNQSDNND